MMTNAYLSAISVGRQSKNPKSVEWEGKLNNLEMPYDVDEKETDRCKYSITKHARMRFDARRIRPNAVDDVIRFGRVSHVRGATIHSVGWREVRDLKKRGIDISALEGIHIVCSPDGAILTGYRNRDIFPRDNWHKWAPPRREHSLHEYQAIA